MIWLYWAGWTCLILIAWAGLSVGFAVIWSRASRALRRPSREDYEQGLAAIDAYAADLAAVELEPVAGFSRIAPSDDELAEMVDKWRKEQEGR